MSIEGNVKYYEDVIEEASLMYDDLARRFGYGSAEVYASTFARELAIVVIVAFTS